MNINANSIQPLFAYVLIAPLEDQMKTPSGIVLPETAKEKPQMGKVMAVRPKSVDNDRKKQPIIVKVGQKVMYKKWGGNEIKVGNQEWLLVEQKDIMAIVQ